MFVLQSVWYHVDVELGSGILNKHKFIGLRQALAKSSTWLAEVWGKCHTYGIRC